MNVRWTCGVAVWITCTAVGSVCAAPAPGGMGPAKPWATSAIKIGLCADPPRYEAAKRAGFDYVEVGVRVIAELSDEDYAKARAEARRLELPLPVGNSFIPPDLKIVGPTVDRDKLMAYVKRALDRVAGLGVKTVVFGSGGARKVPDGFPRQEAWQQLVDFGRRAAHEAGQRGITLAVEPLRSAETNIINTADEGWRLVKDVHHPRFQLMVDFYHLASEQEDPAIIVRAGRAIRHFHIANPTGRVYPMDAAEADYAAFFAAVRRIRYRGGISVEGKTDDLAVDGPRAIGFLRAAAAGDPDRLGARP